jgi:hypothetical protein
MNNEAVIDVLLIDDIKDNYDSYRGIAATKKINLKYNQYGDTGLREIEENRSIMAVVLDGKGFLKSTDQRGDECESFVTTMLQKIAVIELQQNRKIYKCVLTAWYEQFRPFIGEDVIIYDKSNGDELKMFQNIRNVVSNWDEYLIQMEHSGIFNKLRNRSNQFPKMESRLMLLLLEMGKGKFLQEDNFNQVRSILEKTFKELKKTKNVSLPNELFNSFGDPIMEKCVSYLQGREVKLGDRIVFEKIRNSRIPPFLGYHLNLILRISNNFSHDYEGNTTYTFKSIMNSLLEYLTWFFNEIEESV